MKPNEAKPNSLFIFDDIALEQQHVVQEFFCMGRHNNIDCFYLHQTFVRTPKHLCRDNANVLVIFKQDDQNLKHIYNGHVGSDCSFEQFKEMCSLCWEKLYGFLTIFKDYKLNEGRYRMGFDHYIKLRS